MNRLFFSDALIERLQQMAAFSLSALEAPAGYGKTTAVHRIIDRFKGCVFWYTAVENMPDTSFRWFIRQIGQADAEAAQRLENLGFLNRSNAAQAARIIGEIRVDEPLILVFDNFQFAVDNWQPAIFDSLAKRAADGLHTIFISQSFGKIRTVLNALEQSICYLKSSDLLLSEKEIQTFARQLGVSVGEEECRRIFQNTTGWPAAVSLYLENLSMGENQNDERDINDLLFNCFWKRLTDQEQQALLRICLFDCISTRTADMLLPDAVIPAQSRRQLLMRIPLTRYHEEREEFYLHEILLRFLRVRLENADKQTHDAVYCNSGRVYQKNGMTKAAVTCFYQARDYEGILSCRLVCLVAEAFDGVSYTAIARDVLRETPADIQKKYPLSLLRLCYALYAGCAFDEFEAQIARVGALLEERGDSQLMGEWHMVKALSFFPDLERMGEEYERAEELMDRPSEIFIREEPFMFGCTSFWYLFYARAGAMMQTADRLDEVMKTYNRLTNGHGAGAAEIYRGEAYSVQGRFEESDIQAYQAAFLAEQNGNASATYGAALLLGINAIYRSDMIGLRKAVDYLENKAQGYSFLQGKALNTCMVETVRGYLLGLMMEPSRSAVWTQGEADALSDLTFTTFMTKTCRITDMILKREYKRAIASVEASLRLDSRLISVATRNFMYCGLALCYMAVGRLAKAAQYLEQSLALAEQDKNYTFLACFRKYFQVLFLMPNIAVRHAAAVREIRALDIRYTRADESHIFDMLDESLDNQFELTKREREVAELAAKGLRNQEIAEQLHISENTVKQHLKTAFQKMNIDRRGKLIEMLKQ